MTACLVAGCLPLAIADIAGRHGMTFPRRQTYGAATGYVSLRAASFIWGLDIGLGFTTFRVSRAYWAGVLLLISGAPGWLCFAGTVLYAAGLGSAVRLNRDVLIPEHRVIARRRRTGVITAGAAAFVLALVLLTG